MRVKTVTKLSGYCQQKLVDYRWRQFSLCCKQIISSNCYYECWKCSPLTFSMLSGSDAITVQHMHDGMVCHHRINKQSWILCTFYWQCQFNKVHI